MKILGVGLSKTGTHSLHQALQILGFTSLHYDRERLTDILDGSTPRPDFRRYDDIDAVFDIPSAYFYRELLAAYPASKAILTVRDLDSWWQSVSFHMNKRFPLASAETDDEAAHNRFRMMLRNCVYGSVVAHEFLYKKKYAEHNERVQVEIPASRLLVMDIIAGDGWDKLCPFLNMAVPAEPFPHAFKTPYQPSQGCSVLRTFANKWTGFIRLTG